MSHARKFYGAKKIQIDKVGNNYFFPNCGQNLHTFIGLNENLYMFVWIKWTKTVL